MDGKTTDEQFCAVRVQRWKSQRSAAKEVVEYRAGATVKSSRIPTQVYSSGIEPLLN